MKNLLLLVCLLIVTPLFGEERFGRHVIKVNNQKDYEFFKLDDVHYPTLSNDRYSVSCLVYRGTERYYVEIGIKNKTSDSLNISTSFVDFNKPGYTVFRTNTMLAAQEAASVAGLRFAPTAAPYVPPTTNTSINATATTYGNQTQISGTATTTTDYSGQAGANLGNAVGNAIAAHRFYKAQKIEAAFSSYLAIHSQPSSGISLSPGEVKTVVATFQQAKQKKAPFQLLVHVGADTFTFTYKE
jgi:hypothetical protein